MTPAPLDLSKYDGHTEGPWRSQRIGASHNAKEKGMAFRILSASYEPEERELGIVYNKPYFEAAQANAALMADAHLLLAEVVRLRELVREGTHFSCPSCNEVRCVWCGPAHAEGCAPLCPARLLLPAPEATA